MNTVRIFALLFFAIHLLPIKLFAQCGAVAVCLSPGTSQNVVQPPNTSLNINRFSQIQFADQLPGADIGAQINQAITDLPPSGGEVYISASATCRPFATPIVISKNVVLRGAGQGFPSDSRFGTCLQYTGSGTAIEVNSVNNQSTLRDFALDNSSGLGIGIDVVNSQNLSIEHITIFPTSGQGFQYAVRLNFTDPNGHVINTLLRDVIIRANQTGLLVRQLNGLLFMERTKFTYNTFHDLVIGQVGAEDTIHVACSDCQFDSAANTSPVSIVKAKMVSFTNTYFEHDGTGYAIDIPSSGTYGWTVTLDKCSFYSGSQQHLSTYAININANVAGTLNLFNSYFANYANPGYESEIRMQLE